MSAAQSALEARSLDVIQCEDKSGQFICYRSGQIYLLTTEIVCTGQGQRCVIYFFADYPMTQRLTATVIPAASGMQLASSGGLYGCNPGLKPTRTGGASK